MARIRTIKPEFPQSESMGRVSRDARLLFVLLWTVADDEGRLRGNARMVASLLFPYDDDASSLMDGWLNELHREQCIVRYSADGNSYIQITKWTSHQKIDRPTKSKFPDPPEVAESVFTREDSSKAREDSRGLDESSRGLVVGPGPGPKDQGSKEVDHAAASASATPEHTNGKRKKFVIPTPDEVRDYATSNGYQVDAERFWDFYEAKGWKVGNQPMKNWQACVRTWARGSPKAPTTQGEITVEEIFGPDYRSRL